jgi:hypothetical protein
MTEKLDGPKAVDVILYGHADGKNYTVVVVFGWDRPLARNDIRLGKVGPKDYAVDLGREFCEYFGLKYDIQFREQRR